MWQPPPMPRPASAQWGLVISDADFEKLNSGLEPQDVDDRWQFKATEDSESGALTIHIVRGFYAELYSVVMKKYDDASGGTINKIDTINWSQGQGTVPVSEALAKKQVVLLSRCNLECEFEAAPAYEEGDFFDEPTEDTTANGAR